MKITNLAITLTGAGLLFAGVAFAQVATTPKAKQNAINRCTTIEGNVDKRLTNFRNQRTRQLAQFKKAQTKAERLVSRLDEKGYDVSALRLNLVAFDGMIQKFGDDYNVYIAGLAATKEFTCGRSEGEFKEKLAITRAQLKTVREDAVSVRTFWSQTMKPVIQTLKLQPSNPTTEGGTL